jgi:hypothetical protein
MKLVINMVRCQWYTNTQWYTESWVPYPRRLITPMLQTQRWQVMWQTCEIGEIDEVGLISCMA